MHSLYIFHKLYRSPQGLLCQPVACIRLQTHAPAHNTSSLQFSLPPPPLASPSPMAGSSPRKRANDGIMDFIPRHDLVKPTPRSMVRFVCDYDIVSIGKMLSAPES